MPQRKLHCGGHNDRNVDQTNGHGKPSSCMRTLVWVGVGWGLTVNKPKNTAKSHPFVVTVHGTGLGSNHAHSFPNNGSNWGEGVVMQHLVQGATEDQMSSTAPVIVQKWERMQKKNAKRDDKHGKIQQKLSLCKTGNSVRTVTM